MARPIPEPAPVTMALFPLRRSISPPDSSWIVGTISIMMP
jgi:hypothetical protein